MDLGCVGGVGASASAASSKGIGRGGAAGLPTAGRLGIFDVCNHPSFACFLRRARVRVLSIDMLGCNGKNHAFYIHIFVTAPALCSSRGRA